MGITVIKKDGGGGAAGGVLTKYEVTSDVIINNVAGAQDITGLSFDVVVGKKYIGFGYVLAGSDDAVSASQPRFTFDTADGNLLFSYGGNAISTPYNIPMNFRINGGQISGALFAFVVDIVDTNHTITMQFQQNIQGVYNTIVRKGSYILLQEV
jgi:hypothetical protein